MKKYRIIDSHCHIYPDKIARKASDSTSEFYHMPSLYDGKISTLLEEGTRAGIGHFVIQSVATTPKQVSSINHFIAGAVATGGGRFRRCGSLLIRNCSYFSILKTYCKGMFIKFFQFRS